MVPFQVSALPRTAFAGLFALSDGDLAARNVRRMVVTEKPGFPCRVSLADAEVGESVLLLSFTHQPADSPYRSSGAIFVRETAAEASPAVNEVPAFLRHRLLSFRGYDTEGMMVRAEVSEGTALEEVVGRMFSVAETAYIHVHNAKPGCFNCRIDRAMAG